MAENESSPAVTLTDSSQAISHEIAGQADSTDITKGIPVAESSRNGDAELSRLARLLAHNPYKPSQPQPLAVCGSYTLFVDPVSLYPLYQNVATAEVTWEKPRSWDDAEATVPPLAILEASLQRDDGKDGTSALTDKADRCWYVYRDHDSMFQYFVDSMTGDARWTPPDAIKESVVSSDGCQVRWTHTYETADNIVRAALLLQGQVHEHGLPPDAIQQPLASLLGWTIYASSALPEGSASSTAPLIPFCLYYYEAATELVQWDPPLCIVNAELGEWEAGVDAVSSPDVSLSASGSSHSAADALAQLIQTSPVAALEFSIRSHRTEEETSDGIEKRSVGTGAHTQRSHGAGGDGVSEAATSLFALSPDSHTLDAPSPMKAWEQSPQASRVSIADLQTPVSLLAATTTPRSRTPQSTAWTAAGTEVTPTPVKGVACRVSQHPPPTPLSFQAAGGISYDSVGSGAGPNTATHFNVITQAFQAASRRMTASSVKLQTDQMSGEPVAPSIVSESQPPRLVFVAAGDSSTAVDTATLSAGIEDAVGLQDAAEKTDKSVQPSDLEMTPMKDATPVRGVAWTSPVRCVTSAVHANGNTSSQSTSLTETVESAPGAAKATHGEHPPAAVDVASGRGHHQIQHKPVRARRPLNAAATKTPTRAGSHAPKAFPTQDSSDASRNITPLSPLLLTLLHNNLAREPLRPSSSAITPAVRTDSVSWSFPTAASASAATGVPVAASGGSARLGDPVTAVRSTTALLPSLGSTRGSQHNRKPSFSLQHEPAASAAAILLPQGTDSRTTTDGEVDIGGGIAALLPTTEEDLLQFCRAVGLLPDQLGDLTGSGSGGSFMQEDLIIWATEYSMRLRAEMASAEITLSHASRTSKYQVYAAQQPLVTRIQTLRTNINNIKAWVTAAELQAEQQYRASALRATPTLFEDSLSASVDESHRPPRAELPRISNAASLPFKHFASTLPMASGRSSGNGRATLHLMGSDPTFATTAAGTSATAHLSRTFDNIPLRASATRGPVGRLPSLGSAAQHSVTPHSGARGGSGSGGRSQDMNVEELAHSHSSDVGTNESLGSVDSTTSSSMRSCTSASRQSHVLMQLPHALGKGPRQHSVSSVGDPQASRAGGVPHDTPFTSPVRPAGTHLQSFSRVRSRAHSIERDTTGIDEVIGLLNDFN